MLLSHRHTARRQLFSAACAPEAHGPSVHQLPEASLQGGPLQMRFPKWYLVVCNRPELGTNAKTNLMQLQYRVPFPRPGVEFFLVSFKDRLASLPLLHHRPPPGLCHNRCGRHPHSHYAALCLPPQSTTGICDIFTFYYPKGPPKVAPENHLLSRQPCPSLHRTKPR